MCAVESVRYVGIKENDAEWWKSEFWFVVQPVPLSGLLVLLWAPHLRQGDAWSLILTVSLFYLLTAFFFLHYWMFRFSFAAHTFRLSMCLSVMSLSFHIFFYKRHVSVCRGAELCCWIHLHKLELEWRAVMIDWQQMNLQLLFAASCLSNMIFFWLLFIMHDSKLNVFGFLDWQKRSCAVIS